MNKRTFKDLKKTMTEEQLAKFCKKIAEEYAKSDSQFARTYFTNQYNITVSCYYKMLEYAVVENLIENGIVTKMMNKAIANQRLHSNGEGGLSSNIKYQKMLVKRNKKVLDSFDDENIKKLALDFADNPDIGKQDLAAAYGITPRILEKLLEKAIVHNIVDDKTFEEIKKRSLRDANKAAQEYFEKIQRQREEWKN